MTRLLMIRHAQSEWNAQGRWQGRADPPLSELGKSQTRQVVEQLGPVDMIVSSPLERARHTAEIIAESLGIGPVPVDDDLAERDVGEWSGLTNAEIERDWPGYLAQRRRPPGYESDEALLKRTLAALDRITASFDSADILVVCHGGLIYTLEEHHGEAFKRIPNLGARMVIHHGDRTELGDRMSLTD